MVLFGALQWAAYFPEKSYLKMRLTGGANPVRPINQYIIDANIWSSLLMGKHLN
ncbi:hypothetical protein QA597_09730 [Marinilabiliaceae bacterium ANBcel2]|nr:hypothetical protein [Marinilabiliaceae bacterium ANBcel2]